MKFPSVIFALLLSCALELRPGNLPRGGDGSMEPKGNQKVSQSSLAAVQAEIRQILESRESANPSDALLWENLKTAQKFYSTQNYMPAWWNPNGPTPQAMMLLEVLRSSETEGLSAGDYDTQRLQQVLEGTRPPNFGTVPEIAAFDVGLTASALRYMSDLHHGRVDPRRAKWNLELPSADFDEVQFLRQRLISTDKVSATIQELEPAFPGYRRTKAALHRYLELAQQGEGASVSTPSHPVRPGEKYSAAQALAERLRRTGDFPADASMPGSDQAYDGNLVEAVKTFQRRHGLTANGILDATTVKEISVPFGQRAAQLGLAMERWRWLPADTKPPMIVINIPEFQLRAYEEHRLALMMPVVVGKAFRGRETPVFTDELEYLIFRPYWNVPVDITRKELAAKAVRDPEYLQRNGFNIVDKMDNVVELDQFNDEVLQELRSGKLQLRQSPGAANSLGLIKFVFPNTYSVYLHGTPETRLFEQSRRDFSHGCIRVQDPVSLAIWVLRDNPGWTRERIESAIGAEAPERVNLPRPLPVLVLYGTAMVEENGEVRFYRDIYGLDEILKRLLDKRPR